jgi:hypothetical protein
MAEEGESLSGKIGGLMEREGAHLGTLLLGAHGAGVALLAGFAGDTSGSLSGVASVFIGASMLAFAIGFFIACQMLLIVYKAKYGMWSAVDRWTARNPEWNPIVSFTIRYSASWLLGRVLINQPTFHQHG